MAFRFPENVNFSPVVDWKAKYEEAIQETQESKRKADLANSIVDQLRAQRTTAYAARDEANYHAAALERDLRARLTTLEAKLKEVEAELDKVKDDLVNADVLNDELEAEIEELKSPEVEADESLSDSEEEDLESESSDKPETSPTYEDSSFQVVVPEEPVIMPPTNAESVAALEAEIEELRRDFKKAEDKLVGNSEYIERTEKQAAEFERKYQEEQQVSAKLKEDLKEAKSEVQARERDISGKNGYEDQLEAATATIDKELKPQLAQQIELNKILKDENEELKKDVAYYREQKDAVAQENSEIMKKDKRTEKVVEKREVEIEQLNEKLGEVAHFEEDLYAHQQILQDTVTVMNESVDDGPKFNAHPEAYVAPEINDTVSQTLFQQLSGLSSPDGDSSSFEELESDTASEGAADVEDSTITNAKEGIEAEQEEIAEDQRILDQKLRQVDLIEVEIKVPVEEVTVVPAGPASVSILPESQLIPHIHAPVTTAPATPKIIKEVDRVVFNGKDVHSWSHIERDFLVLVLAFFNYFTGILWPSFVQEVRGIAPISNHPIPVPGSEDVEGAESGDLPESGSLPHAMVNSAIAASAPDPSAFSTGTPQGSDPNDTQAGTGDTETDDFATLLTPLPTSPDDRESIAFAPPASPPRQPASSSNTDNAAANLNNRISPTADGKGDQFGPPGPPSGDGNGTPQSPPGPPNGDGFGTSPAAIPGFWDVFTPRPLPSIKWTLLGMFLHLVVYYCVYLTIDSYFERNLWLAANDATRQWLNSIMGVRYTNGILRKILSENWATRIDRSLLYAVTKAGIMELKTFPMPVYGSSLAHSGTWLSGWQSIWVR
ncbi:hypothetical protein BKA64DRAFT_725419 [Cadophora sp. MPI-SDFR-AT-0126]|nr:hypothetical protein BKA64DRAFT_725419 [Leotiomycetes sp. MPI-SDFR-AT-0126]